MKTYVILLKRDEKRRLHVENTLVPELSKTLQVEIFDAVDVKDNNRFMKALNENPIVFTQPMQMGAYGCFLSHFEIWKKIANGDDEMALILEDDANSTNFFLNNFNDVISEMPKNTDILYLYTCPVQKKRLEEMKRVEGTKFIVEPYYTWCLLSYVMTKKCAKFLVENMKVAELPVDDELCKHYWHKLNVFLTTENFFYSIGQMSINENAEMMGKFKSNIHGTPYIKINYN